MTYVEPNEKKPDTRVFKQEEIPEPPIILSPIDTGPQGNAILRDSEFISANYAKNKKGWRIDADGNAEFNSGIFRGRFEIGGTLITISKFSDIQDTIDFLSVLGGGTVAFVPGTYIATSSITIPSNITLDGNGATIDFNNGAYQILVQGTNAYVTGTVTVTNNSTSVVGVGTTWTAAMIGQKILIQDFWYEVVAVTDTTHITIGQVYKDGTASGISYVMAETVDGVSIINLTVQNSSIALIKARYVNVFTLDTVVMTNGLIGLDMDDSSFINFLNSTVDSCGTGITLDNSNFLTFFNWNLFNSTSGGGIIINICQTSSFEVWVVENCIGDSFSLTNGNDCAISDFGIDQTTGVGIKLLSCQDIEINLGTITDQSSDGVKVTSSGGISVSQITIRNSGEAGINFVSGDNDNQISSCLIDSSTSDGIKLTDTIDRSSVIGTSIINSGGYGINIAASTCDNNQIIAPAFNNNASGNINDSGTGTFISPQTLSTFVVQDINLAVTSVVGFNNNFQVMTTDTTGTVLFLGQDYGGTTATIFRLLKDIVTGNYKITHSTTLTVSTAGLNGMAVIGNNLFVCANIAATSSLRRYSTTDLSGVTTMTISGTNDLSNGPAWSDGTDLYTYQSSGVFRKYTISGTTATNAGTVAFTTTGVATACVCDGTNVWTTDSVSSTINIRKYAKAGGAVISTTTITLFTQADLNVATNCSLGFFIGSTTILGLGWFYNNTSATTVIGAKIHLTAIALP